MKNNVFEKIMNIYKKSWEEQDSNLILTIFSNDWIYHDKPHNTPLKWHNEIKKYWEKYPVSDQKNIKFELLNYVFANWIYYAEWKSNFDEISTWKRADLRWIFLIELEKEKIKKLKEYWHLKRT